MTEIVEESVENPIRKLVTVQRVVDLEPIEGKDRIELAKILGYRCVVEKGTLRIGAFVAFHEPDSFVPVDAEHGAYAFLAPDAKERDGDFKRTRIKTRKFGPAYSQGLAVALAKLALPVDADVREGSDLTVILNVTKYEPAPSKQPGTPGARSIRGVNQFPWPAELDGITKTDEERLQSSPGLLNEMRGQAAYVSIKYDGQSVTVAKDLDGRVFVCSRNHEWREVEGHPLDGFNANVRALGIAERLPPGTAVQGEMCGPGIQKNKAGFAGLRFFVFNAFRRLVEGETWEELGMRDGRGFVAGVGLEAIPLVQRGWLIDERHTVDEMVALSQQEYPNGYPAEGIVIRPEEPKRSRYGYRLSCKVINPAFEARS